MAFEHAIWRLDGGLARLPEASLETEACLEDYIASDVGILNAQWMIIGRQVRTDYGKCIDLLAVDDSGALIVIELKREQTPREVVTQALDYASWIETLTSERIAAVFKDFRARYPQLASREETLDDAYQARFGIDLTERELNHSHQIVVVASRLDAGTERIVQYLSSRSVAINVVFFKVFTHDAHRLLSRVWFIDPASTEQISKKTAGKASWNGEYLRIPGDADRRSGLMAITIPG